MNERVTNRQTEQPTNQPTDTPSYRGALSHLKNNNPPLSATALKALLLWRILHSRKRSTTVDVLLLCSYLKVAYSYTPLQRVSKIKRNQFHRTIDLYLFWAEFCNWRPIRSGVIQKYREDISCNKYVSRPRSPTSAIDLNHELSILSKTFNFRVVPKRSLSALQ